LSQSSADFEAGKKGIGDTLKVNKPRGGERPEKRLLGWDGPCPHCGEPIKFRLETNFGEFVKAQPDIDWLASVSETERELLSIAESTGVFASYQQAMAGAGLKVGNPAKSFLRFLNGMSPYNLSPALALSVQSEFPDCKTVQLYNCGGVAAITVQGALRLFIPLDYLAKKKLAPRLDSTGTVKIKHLTENMDEFHSWVKTRMGYVPQSGGLFMQEMRKRCYGAFGTHEKARGVGGIS
jgi:hypothetical protein